MPKYILTAKDFEGSLVVEFDGQGILRGFQDESQMRPDQRDWLASNFPLTEEKLQRILTKAKGLSCKLADYDLSFNNFWETYGYKIGNKKRAEKLWNGLSQADKVKALEAIPAYNYYLQTRPHLEKLYPETFISQRRYETDYRAAIKR